MSKKDVNNANENFDNDDFEKEAEPIEYKPPFPLEKVAVTAVIAIIVILIAIIFLRDILSNSNHIIPRKGSAENTVETTTESDVYSITNDENESDANIENDYSNAVLKSSNTITCWGDEYMAGSKTNDFSIPTYLARKISGVYNVFNSGCYNEDILGIAERQGGVGLVVSPIVIPEEPIEVPIEIKNMYGGKCNISISNDQNGGLNPCTIGDVEGTLAATGQGYTFKRTKTGKTLAITHPVILKTKAAVDRRNDIQIIFIGKEQKYDTDEIISIYKNMADYINPIVKSYIIIGFAEGTSKSNEEFDKRMTQEFGRHYINIREYLSSYACTELGITPTAEDKRLMSQGSVPKSLMFDDYSFTPETNNLIADVIYERLVELNIL